MKSKFNLFHFLMKSFRCVIFQKKLRKAFFLCCCLGGLIFYLIMPAVYAGSNEPSAYSTRAIEYTFGSTTLEGTPPIQKAKSWCVFACVSFFRNRMQCMLASEYGNRYSQYPLDCCVFPPLNPIYEPDMLEEILSNWNSKCFSGVLFDSFIDFITKVDTQIAYLGDLQTHLEMGRYMGNIFPCYGVVVNGADNAHCIIICGVARREGVCRIHYWDPEMGYKTIYSGTGDIDWHNTIYYYKRYLNVG